MEWGWEEGRWGCEVGWDEEGWDCPAHRVGVEDTGAPTRRDNDRSRASRTRRLLVRVGVGEEDHRIEVGGVTDLRGVDRSRRALDGPLRIAWDYQRGSRSDQRRRGAIEEGGVGEVDAEVRRWEVGGPSLVCPVGVGEVDRS